MSVTDQQSAFVWTLVIGAAIAFAFTIYVNIAYFRAILRARAYEYGMIVPHVDKVDKSGNHSIVVLSKRAGEMWVCVPATLPDAMLEEWANSTAPVPAGQAWQRVDLFNHTKPDVLVSFSCDDDSKRRHVKLSAC